MPSTYDDVIDGISTSVAVKAPCRIATTANITRSGLQTIDGITLVADDRVLVKDQTDAEENGIYVASATTWARARDFDGARDAVRGTVVYVVSGTANGNKFFQLTTSDPVIGTSDLAFSAIDLAFSNVSVYIKTLLDDADAATARATLGSGTTGDAVFTAATAQAARTALGASATGDAVFAAATALAAREALDVTPTGEVRMINASGNTWTVYAPDGSVVDTTGTTTSGLQEAIDYAGANGYDLKVVGRDGAPSGSLYWYRGAWLTATAYDLGEVVENGGTYYQLLVPHTSGTFATDLAAGKWAVFDYATLGTGVPTGWGLVNGRQIYYPNNRIECSTGIIFPTCQGKVLDLRGATINYTGTGTAVAIDSGYQNTFRFGTLSGVSAAVVLAVAPTKRTGYLDGVAYDIAAFFHNTVDVMNIAASATGGGVGLGVDATGGSVTENLFSINEAAAGDAVLSVNAGGGSACRGNTFHYNRLYGSGVAAKYTLRCLGGTATTHNEFAGIIMPLIAGAYGIKSDGQYNVFRGAILGDEAGGSIAIGIDRTGSSDHNRFELVANEAVIPVQDLGTGRDYGNLTGVRPRFAAYLAANQTINNAATDLVGFATVVFDDGSGFDTTNKRWVPGRKGRARIGAKVELNGGAAGAAMRLYLRRNGTALKSNANVFAGSSQESVMLDESVDVTSATDYFDITLLNQTGAAHDIVGGIEQSSFYGEMLE